MFTELSIHGQIQEKTILPILVLNDDYNHCAIEKKNKSFKSKKEKKKKIL